jgi:hypothetical protein
MVNEQAPVAPAVQVPRPPVQPWKTNPAVFDAVSVTVSPELKARVQLPVQLVLAPVTLPDELTVPVPTIVTVNSGRVNDAVIV